jgi:hypothetical protein
MTSTTLSHKGAILIIEMKIASELLWGWLANIAAIALLLCLGQILDRHLFMLPLVCLAVLWCRYVLLPPSEKEYHKHKDRNRTNVYVTSTTPFWKGNDW